MTKYTSEFKGDEKEGEAGVGNHGREGSRVGSHRGQRGGGGAARFPQTEKV